LLFDVARQLKGDFLMTYDDASMVKELADRYGFQVEPISMSGTHHTKTTELLIGRNVEWAKA
jgi:DNA adenine methylase